MSSNAVNPSNPALEQVDLDVPEGDAYEHWRKTGELPSDEKEMEKVEEKVRQEENQEPSPKGEAAAPKKETSVTRAGSEPARPPQKKDANARIRELLGELKAEREDKRKLIERLSSAAPATAETRKEESRPSTADASKAAAEPQIEDKDDKGEVKYKTWGEYQKAHDKWVFEEADRRANARFDERFNQTQKETEEQRETERIRSTFGPRVQAAMKKYPDFQQVAFNPDLPIVKGSLIEQYILDSEIGPEIAYYLGQNPEEVTKITGLSQEKNAQGLFLRTGTGMPNAAAARYLAMIELSLIGDEEATPPKSSAKPVTKAPPPPRQVAGKPPQTKSDEAQALDDADEGDETAVQRYMDAANRREIEARKARRR